MTAFEILSAIACIGIPYFGGLVGSLFIIKNIEWYKSLKQSKPSISAWVFGTARFIQYGCMGLASWLILGEADHGAAVALPLSIYSATLIFEWSWLCLYFGLRNLKVAIIAILGATILTAVSGHLFCPINFTAGVLMLPCVAWMCFMTYMTISTAILNRKVKDIGGTAEESKTK